LFDVSSDGVPVLRVHVLPGAGRTAVVGRHGDALKVRVAAPPEKGKANDACTVLLASLFDVPAADVELTGGASSRSKRFRVTGLDEQTFVERLEMALEGADVPPGGNAGARGGVSRRRPGR
ncbi:MAG TPA: DUF167 domain-containing protein, partial [Acidimicrobiales bacterium]|nr:DUF167 domain-containing protein [Acidimicrobiales bacterium]